MDNYLTDINKFFNSTTQGNNEIKTFNITKNKLLNKYPDVFYKRSDKKILFRSNKEDEMLKIMKQYYLPYLMNQKTDDGQELYKAYIIPKKYKTVSGEERVYQNVRLVKKKPTMFEPLLLNDDIKNIIDDMTIEKIKKTEAINRIYTLAQALDILSPKGKNYTMEQITNWVYRF